FLRMRWCERSVCRLCHRYFCGWLDARFDKINPTPLIHACLEGLRMSDVAGCWRTTAASSPPDDFGLQVGKTAAVCSAWAAASICERREAWLRNITLAVMPDFTIRCELLANWEELQFALSKMDNKASF